MGLPVGRDAHSRHDRGHGPDLATGRLIGKGETGQSGAYQRSWGDERRVCGEHNSAVWPFAMPFPHEVIGGAMSLWGVTEGLIILWLLLTICMAIVVTWDKQRP